jgi:predicted Ser/Thr protein kinase
VRSCPKCGSTYPDNVQFCPLDGSALAPQQPEPGADPRLGTLIDRYRVAEKLGEGGMGMVYRAEHTMIGRPVALKLLHPDLARNAEAVDRFFREARAANEVASDHIVQVTDFGRTNDGANFLVMEFLTGTSLQELLARERSLDPRRAATIAYQIASGLSSAHERNVIHRDLKPANVQLVERGADKEFVKLLDFGIAKMSEGGTQLTKTGMILGSPAYMSPEQASGTKVDHRTDIYALGVILYEMLVGTPPFTGESPTQILLAHVSSQPPPPRTRHPGVPESLEQLIMECLAKDPASRPANMGVVMERLAAYLEAAPAAQTVAGHAVSAPAAGAAIVDTGKRAAVTGADAVAATVGVQSMAPTTSDGPPLQHLAPTPVPGGPIPPGAQHLAPTPVPGGPIPPGAQHLAPTPVPGGPISPAAAATGVGTVAPTQARQGGGKKLLLIGIIAGVLLSAAAVTVAFVFLKGEPAEKTPGTAGAAVNAAAVTPTPAGDRTAVAKAALPDAAPEPAEAPNEPDDEATPQPTETPDTGRTRSKPPARRHRRSRPSQRSSTHDEPAAEPAPPTEPPPPAKPAPPVTRPKVTIVSVPAGADLYYGAKLMGRTPKSYYTDGATPLRFAVKKFGHETAYVEIQPGERGTKRVQLVVPEWRRTHSLRQLANYFGAGQMSRFQWKMQEKVLKAERDKKIKAVKDAHRGGAFDRQERNRRIDAIKAEYH